MPSWKNIVLIFAVGFLAYFHQTKVIRGPVYNSDKDLNGKTVLITGGNVGIGKSAAILFAKLGARVIIASRNIKKSEQACDEIIKQSKNNNVHAIHLDLEHFDSIKQFADEFNRKEKRLDYLINNAAALALRGMHENGFTKVFSINHFGPFLLTNLLLDLMKSTNEEGRIINVGSEAHQWHVFNLTQAKEDCDGFMCDMGVYGISKGANVLFTKELQKKLEGTKLTTYTVHPGTIESDLGRSLKLEPYQRVLITGTFYFFVRKPFYGAQTIMYCSLDDDVIKHKGEYFYDCQHQHSKLLENGDKDAQELWKLSEKMTRKYLKTN